MVNLPGQTRPDFRVIKSDMLGFLLQRQCDRVKLLAAHMTLATIILRLDIMQGSLQRLLLTIF